MSRNNTKRFTLIFSANGPELEVDAEHDHARQQEGDAGGGDGVDRAKVQQTRGVFLNGKKE